MTEASGHQPKSSHFRNPMGRKKGGPLVEDKRAAKHQITTEELLQQAYELNAHASLKEKKQPTMTLTTAEEVAVYQSKIRQDLELGVQRAGSFINPWLTYAHWEESQKEFAFARSVFERAIDHHGQSPKLWREYIDFEIRRKNLEVMRRVVSRANKVLPTSEELWLKVILIEEAAGDDAKVREAFSTWMTFTPPPSAWKLFIQFELQRNETSRARDLLGQFVVAFNDPASWLFYAAAEANPPLSAPRRAVEVLRTAIEALPEPFADARLHTALAELLSHNGSVDDAREVYTTALQLCDADGISKSIMPSYTAFEEKHGDEAAVEQLLLSKSRARFEETLDGNNNDVETWRRYIAVEEYSGKYDQVAALYERSLNVCIPQCEEWWSVEEKRMAWLPAVNLWLDYAAFIGTQFINWTKASQIHLRILKSLPQGIVFPHLWISLARVAIERKNDVSEFRKAMGSAIGTAASPEIFRFYIFEEAKLLDSLSPVEEDSAAPLTEKQLAAIADQILRIRKLYQNFISRFPSDASVWCECAEFERSVENDDGAEAVLQAGIDLEDEAAAALVDQDRLRMELITLKVRRGDIEGARTLYRMLVVDCFVALKATIEAGAEGRDALAEDLTKFKQSMESIWSFELNYGAGSKQEQVERIRSWVSSFTTSVLQQTPNSEAAKPLIDSWRRFEHMYGDAKTLREVEDTVEAPSRKKQKILKKAAKLLNKKK